ncbi:TPA_asm: P overlapped [Ficus alphacytorhabdovirus 1]|nr:TPA_asm: P overlapped [Ficus alphacytorhabdovirus 1]
MFFIEIVRTSLLLAKLLARYYKLLLWLILIILLYLILSWTLKCLWMMKRLMIYLMDMVKLVMKSLTLFYKMILWVIHKWTRSRT